MWCQTDPGRCWGPEQVRRQSAGRLRNATGRPPSGARILWWASSTPRRSSRPEPRCPDREPAYAHGRATPFFSFWRGGPPLILSKIWPGGFRSLKVGERAFPPFQRGASLFSGDRGWRRAPRPGYRLAMPPVSLPGSRREPSRAVATPPVNRRKSGELRRATRSGLQSPGPSRGRAGK
jgi:hypothetical protein